MQSVMEYPRLLRVSAQSRRSPDEGGNQHAITTQPRRSAVLSDDQSTQRSSGAHIRSSEALSSTPWCSAALRVALSGNQRQSEAIRGNQRPSEAIRGYQRPSEAFRGNDLLRDDEFL